MVLLQNGHALTGRDDDLARGGLKVAGEHLEEGGLARAVRADDAVAVAGGELDVDVLEERLAAVGKRNILRCNHGDQVLLFTALLFQYASPLIISQKGSFFNPLSHKKYLV